MTVQCHVIRMVCLNRYFKIATLAQSSSTANQLIAYYCLGDYFRWGKLLMYNYLILVLVLNFTLASPHYHIISSFFIV